MENDGVNLMRHRRIGSIPGGSSTSVDATNDFLFDLQNQQRKRLTVDHEKDEINVMTKQEVSNICLQLRLLSLIKYPE